MRMGPCGENTAPDLRRWVENAAYVRDVLGLSITKNLQTQRIHFPL
uniref:Uncharacterized protein n=1 Tax=Siphoviridae sp. ct7es18 TaxID=2826166 RepID=A0A8S5MI48_9CAUD|nr:MAG TPA: hypothetical protein [Siphoviridae sp. ct7es18]